MRRRPVDHRPCPRSPSFLERLLPGAALRRAIRNAERASPLSTDRHWAIDEFPSRSEPWEPGGRVCPLGSRTRGGHLDGRFTSGHDVTTAIPFSDEYSEWTDILEAVLDAGETFTFVDVGAGYGRWTSRAAAAARMKDKRFRVAAAEAEPSHSAWFGEHMADNAISDFTLIEAAVGFERGVTLLAVAQPPEEQGPGDWFGQRIGWGEGCHRPPIVGDYLGRPLYGANGWGFIEVEQIPLGDVLAPFEFIDLVDMDIQGAEADAVRGGIDALTATTRRLHVETHTAEVEADLRDTLSRAGWRKLRDYPCLQENQTPFGRAYMEGGVQTWVNPRKL